MGKKILVVDNHPMILKLMGNLLEKEGHEVRVAEDGLSALDVLKSFTPDIMFVDLIMPNISGDKLCRIIRSKPEYKEIFIVILSAIAAEEKVDFAAFGADACIGKGPFKEIAQHVNALLLEKEQAGAKDLTETVYGSDGMHSHEVTRELLSTKRHFEVILNNMSEGILELTPKGRVIYVNPVAVQLIGMREEKILGALLTDFFQNASRDNLTSMLQQVGDEPLLADENVMLQLNSKVVSISILPVQDEEGKSQMVIVSDITDKLKAQEELKRAQALMVRQEKLASIGTLASGVAHEMLNPLNIIGAIAQVMQLEEGLPDTIKENIGEILDQIRRATKITNNLRMFSHSHEQAKETKHVNLNELFNQTFSLLKHDFKTENITIERDFDKKLRAIEADGDQLAQVFINLLNNAKGAMAGGSDKRIKVTTRNDETGVMVSVSDNGAGIPKKYITKIFDPFFTTKSPGQGTGLGLSIVYSIIENHGGSIQVKSEEGKGATFHIHLPLQSKPQKSIDPERLFR